ncbi:MAG: sigma-70 family RNA polymerase sigma factor [bacterium]|nr:sigma-70 family RNA polymerase sigma factor [bacterium]
MSKVSLDWETEKELAGKLNRGQLKQQKAVFAKIYEHYHPHLLRYFKNKVSHEEIAEDLTATVFTKAFESRSNYRWEGVPLSAWLYRIAHNLLVDHYRLAKRSQTVDIADAPPISDTKPTPEDEFQQWEREQSLKELVQRLPQREKNIILLKFFEGYTNRAIAKMTGLSETNVGTIVYRVVKQMRASATV